MGLVTLPHASQCGHLGRLKSERRLLRYGSHPATIHRSKRCEDPLPAAQHFTLLKRGTRDERQGWRHQNMGFERREETCRIMKMKRQMRSWRHQPLFCCFLQLIAFRMFKRDRNGLRTAPKTVLVVNEAFNVHSQREPPVRYISGGYREGRDIAPQEWSVVTFTEFLAKFDGY